MEGEIWENAEMTDGQKGIIVLIIVLVLIIRIMDKECGGDKE